VPLASEDRIEPASTHPFWEWLVAGTLVLLVVVASIVLSVFLSLLLPRIDAPGGAMEPLIPTWEITALCWAVSVPLGFGIALLVGRLPSGQEWGDRLWSRAIIWAPLLSMLGMALLWWMLRDSIPEPDSPANSALDWALTLGAWALGVPLSVTAGLWLSARKDRARCPTSAST
jgi:hypothetical protein